MGLADQAAYFGDVYQAWGRYTEAIEQFVLGIHRASEVSFPFLRQYCYERIAECQEALGDHRAALEATKRATQVRDSIQGENTARTILELKERYNAAEKDRAIALLNERAARRQLYIWAGLGAMVLLVLGGLWSHQHRQRRLRAERDAAIIREREAGLKAVIEATEEERRRLARELHDGVGQQLGGLKHRLEHLRGAPNAPGLQDTITIVDDTAREVRDLAHQLMPKTLSRLGLVPAVEDLLHKAFNATGTKVGLDHVGMEAGVPDSLATGLYRIVQELVGNIIKHAHATAVEVQLLRNKGHVVLIVQDNGRGLVRTEGAVGLGLMNIADRARAMGGTFSIEGGPGRGTVATIRVPLPQ
jgi:signal transduction histidine kinase